MSANTNHWTDQDLLLRLYGAGAGSHVSEAHFAECPECAARRDALSSQRASLLSSELSSELLDHRLRAQRTALWERLERPARSRIWQAVPAAATVFLLVIGVALHQPSPQPQPQQLAAASAVTDEQLFNDIVSVVNQDAPRAADSMRGLFSESEVEAQ